MHPKEKQVALLLLKRIIARMAIFFFLTVFLLSSFQHPFYVSVDWILIGAVAAATWMALESQDDLVVSVSTILFGVLITAYGELMFHAEAITSWFGIPTPPTAGDPFWWLMQGIGKIFYLLLGPYWFLRFYFRSVF